MNETINLEAVQHKERPYTFRKLEAPDIFPMFKIISAIGINEFMAALNGDALKSVLNMFVENGGVDEEKPESVYMMGALAGVLEIANVIFGNLPKCEKEIFQLLSQTSNLTEKQVRKLDFATFAQMVIDFIKKEEFKDFIKVVSELFK